MKNITHPLVLQIRPMRRTDVSAVVKLMRGLQEHHGDKSRTTAKHFIEFCFGKNALSQGWVMGTADILVGFAVSRDWANLTQPSKIRTIDLLYVEEAFRGQGLGESLITAIARDSLAHKIYRLDISASIKNQPTNDFYEHLGFERRKTSTNQYKIEGIALKRFTKRK